jgi:branched-chain amino acid transport system substrate-binding protein
MKNKKLLSLLIIFFTTFLLIIGTPSCKKKEQETIKIGAIYPLTGEASFWGENAKNAVLLAKEMFKGENFLKGKKIEIIIEDSHSNTSDAVSSMNKLIFKDKVSFVVGELISSNLLAIAPIAEKNKILVIGQGSNPKIKDAGEFIFRTWPSDDLQGDAIAKFLNEKLRPLKAGILFVANEYGNGVMEKIKKGCEKIITFSEGYPPDTRNFKNIVQKIKSLGLDTLIVIAYPEELPIILKEIEEKRLNISVVGTETFNNENILNMDTKLNIYFSYPKFASPEDPVYLEFKDKFKKKFNKEPGTPAEAVFDATMLILKGIDSVGYSSERVKNFLFTVKNYDGASGRISFDSNGDVIKSFVIKKIENKKAIDYFNVDW